MNFDVYLFLWFVVIFLEFFELFMTCFVRIAQVPSATPRPMWNSALRVDGRDHDFEPYSSVLVLQVTNPTLVYKPLTTFSPPLTDLSCAYLTSHWSVNVCMYGALIDSADYQSTKIVLTPMQLLLSGNFFSKLAFPLTIATKWRRSGARQLMLFRIHSIKIIPSFILA